MSTKENKTIVRRSVEGWNMASPTAIDEGDRVLVRWIVRGTHEGAVWVGEIYGNVVSRVDPETNQEVARIEVDIPVISVEVGAGAIWAVVEGFEACQRSGLVRIDPETNTAGGRIPVRCAGDIVVSPEGFWVTSYQSREITLFEPAE